MRICLFHVMHARQTQSKEFAIKRIEFSLIFNLNQNFKVWRTHCLDSCSNCSKMSAVHPQPLEPSSSLKISEDGDHVTKDRFFSGSCNCCHKRYLRCSFRVWQFLLLLFAILVILSGTAVLAAVFGPGKVTLGSYRGTWNLIFHLKMSVLF